MRLGAGGLGGRCVPLAPVPLQGFGGEEMDGVGTPVSASLRFLGEGKPLAISVKVSAKRFAFMLEQRCLQNDAAKMEWALSVYGRRGNQCNGKNMSPISKMPF